MHASRNVSLSRETQDLAGWLPCWEIASHSALRVCCLKMFCCVSIFSFPPGVCVGTLNLIAFASIPGPSVLTLVNV